MLVDEIQGGFRLGDDEHPVHLAQGPDQIHPAGKGPVPGFFRQGFVTGRGCRAVWSRSPVLFQRDPGSLPCPFGPGDRVFPTLGCKEFLRGLFRNGIGHLPYRLAVAPGRTGGIAPAKGAGPGLVSPVPALEQRLLFRGRSPVLSGSRSHRFPFPEPRLGQGHGAVPFGFPGHGLGQCLAEAMVHRPVYGTFVPEFNLAFLGMDIDVDEMGIDADIQHRKGEPGFGDLGLVGTSFP